jgi:hypothetical protein
VGNNFRERGLPGRASGKKHHIRSAIMARKKLIPGPDGEFDVFIGKYCHIVTLKTTGESPV